MFKVTTFADWFFFDTLEEAMAVFDTFDYAAIVSSNVNGVHTVHAQKFGS